MTVRFVLQGSKAKGVKSVIVEYYLSSDGESATSEIQYATVSVGSGSALRYMSNKENVQYADDLCGAFARVRELEFDDGTKIDFSEMNEFAFFAY